ncbi:MAG: outer membrane lipoprotein-sorting protein [Saprospiraceae bacterium]
MKKLLLIQVVFLLLAASAPAQDAREIVRRADEKARGASSVATMTITTTRPKWTRSMRIKTWTKGSELALILIQEPAKDRGVTYLKRKKEVWNWSPAIERTIKLPPSMMSQSWMGTDFTNDDLVRESSAVNDYTHSLLGSETVAGRDCYKISMTPRPEAAVVWGKVIVWIDKKDELQLKAEFYDEDGSLASTLLGSDIKKMGDRMLPSRLTMIPANKPGHKTEIVYDSIVFNQLIADSFFTTENMTKVK